MCSSDLEQGGFHVSHGEVIYPGIATELFVGDVKPATAPIKKLLVVSRLDESSGVMTAVQAVLRARENKLPVSLTIYGRGETEYISQLRSFIVQNSLPIDFLTVSKQNRDLAAIYRQHDALLYTTECERDIFHSQDDTADGPFHCAPSALRAVLPWGSELLRSGAHLSPLSSRGGVSTGWSRMLHAAFAAGLI